MSGETFRCFATAAFGTEGLVASELKRLGFRDAKAASGGACFASDAAGIAVANLRLRCADRVLILLAEEKCETLTRFFAW